MDLARHSDVNSTMAVYGHTVVQDRAEALEAMPDIVAPSPSRGEQRKTGACDWAPVPEIFGCDDKQSNKRTAESSHVLTPCRARTCDPLIKRPHSGGGDGSKGVSGLPLNEGGSRRTEVHEGPENTGDSEPVRVGRHAPNMHEDASSRPAGGTHPDKQNDKPDNKQNDKLSTTDVVDLLSETINHVRTGQLDPKVGNCVGYLSGIILKAAEQGGMEERLAALEGIVSSQSRPTSLFDTDPEDLVIGGEDRAEPQRATA